MTERIKSLALMRLIFAIASTISIIFTSGPTHASVSPDGQSPLLTQSLSAQSRILRIIDLIRQAAGGKLDADNARSSVRSVISAYKGVTLEQVAAALNQLHLQSTVLSHAVQGTAEGFNVKSDAVLSALIVDTYMSRGKNDAQRKVTNLRNTFGEPAINDALSNADVASLMSHPDIFDIEPQAGDTTVYDG